MKSVILSICIFMLAAALSSAGVQNGSFENELQNWTPSGYEAEIMASFDPIDYGSLVSVPISPVDGTNLVVLKSGGNTYFTGFCMLEQEITLNNNDTISGAYFFATRDYMGYNDAASVKLIAEDTELTLAFTNVEQVGDFGAMKGWDTFSYHYKGPDNAVFKLQLLVQDVQDTILSSYLAIDNIVITPVPEPCSAMLVLAGALAIFRKQA